MADGSIRDKLNELLGRYQSAKDTVQRERLILLEATDRVEHAEEAQRVIQEIAQRIQQSANDNIAKVVSRCLATIFDNPYEFKIVFERRRGRTEADLIFTRDGHEYDPMDGSGGGVKDIAAFGLRLGCQQLALPKRRDLMIMDEPFKFLHPKSIRPRVRELLLGLAKDLGIQFIMSTGVDELITGKVIEVE